MRQLGDLSEFHAALKQAGDALVCVDFTAAWCGPCQMIGPRFAAMEHEFPESRFVKVDVDEAQDIAAQCGIRSMPTFHFYHQGQLIEQFSGADEGRLRAIVIQNRFRLFDVLPIGTRVLVGGLQGAPQHNGKEGAVVGYDGARYQCQLPGGEVLALKPANVRQTAVPVTVLAQAAVYGAVPGGQARLMAYDEGANEYNVLEEPVNSARSLPLDCVLLPPGTRATTARLTDASRNGVRVKVLSYDADAGRYAVLCKSDGSQWKLKPGNVICV
jgi:thioredoxin